MIAETAPIIVEGYFKFIVVLRSEGVYTAWAIKLENTSQWLIVDYSIAPASFFMDF